MNGLYYILLELNSKKQIDPRAYWDKKLPRQQPRPLEHRKRHIIKNFLQANSECTTRQPRHLASKVLFGELRTFRHPSLRSNVVTAPASLGSFSAHES